jgi:hypothetical protein
LNCLLHTQSTQRCVYSVVDPIIHNSRLGAVIALDVTYALQQHSVSCLPLLDDKAALVDVLSENDLLLIPCSKVLLPARHRAALPQSPSRYQ